MSDKSPLECSLASGDGGQGAVTTELTEKQQRESSPTADIDQSQQPLMDMTQNDQQETMTADASKSNEILDLAKQGYFRM